MNSSISVSFSQPPYLQHRNANVYSSCCTAVGTAWRHLLCNRIYFEIIRYVSSQPLKDKAAKQWADFVCITRAINVYVLKELFWVDPPILERTTPTCRQVRVAHLSDHMCVRVQTSYRLTFEVNLIKYCSNQHVWEQTNYYSKNSQQVTGSGPDFLFPIKKLFRNWNLW